MQRLFFHYSLILLILIGLPLPAATSSHREAPGIAGMPKLDGTDLFAFRSYEAGRSEFVVLGANYQPFQDPFAGPTYYPLDPNAVYEIHVDEDGDTVEDLTFRFDFGVSYPALTVQPSGVDVEVPFYNRGAFDETDSSELNVVETYEVRVVQGRTSVPVEQVGIGFTQFTKPADRVGDNSIADYAAYAETHVYDVLFSRGSLPVQGRLFVGQRKDPFVANLGPLFDGLDFDPTGPIDGQPDSLAAKNVTTLMLEIPRSFFATDTIAVWTSSSLGGQQVSRVGAPLVNTLMIGLSEKDAYNQSHPSNVFDFGNFFLFPALPPLLSAATGSQAPTNYPRNDLLTALLQGLPGLNTQVQAGTTDNLRLNHSISPTALASQNEMGILGGDSAGFPNGRRPGDDVVDIMLTLLQGGLCHEPAFSTFVCSPSDAPDGNLRHTDGAAVDAGDFLDHFPFFHPPIARFTAPEPTTSSMLSSGVALLFALARRRSRRFGDAPASE